MKTIHKHVLTGGRTTIQTCERARFLHVHTQHGEPTLWVEVNALERECLRVVDLVPTGGDVPTGGTYLGTAVDVGGAYVFHAYLLPEGDGRPG